MDDYEKQQKINKNILEEIINNYEDIEDEPPNYYDILPPRDECEINILPDINITIKPLLNTKEDLENFKKPLHLMMEGPSQFKLTPNETTKMNNITEIKIIQNTQNKQLQFNKEELNKIQKADSELYIKVCKELKDLYESYYIINNFLKSVMNNYEVF
jgi:hypothetical protein